MRTIPLYEKNKRGCAYCVDVERKRRGKGYRLSCPHTQCPYHALDKHESYEEFMASEDAKILVDGFFQTAASCYELGNGNAQVRQIFGGKEYRGFL